MEQNTNNQQTGGRDERDSSRRCIDGVHERVSYFDGIVDRRALAEAMFLLRGEQCRCRAGGTENLFKGLL